MCGSERIEVWGTGCRIELVGAFARLFVWIDWRELIRKDADRLGSTHNAIDEAEPACLASNLDAAIAVLDAQCEHLAPSE